jgi:hypothetical protein
MFIFIIVRLFSHTLPLLDIALAHDFSVESRAAVNDSDKEKYDNGSDVGPCFQDTPQHIFKENDNHDLWQNYSRQNNGILPRNTDF